MSPLHGGGNGTWSSTCALAEATIMRVMARNTRSAGEVMDLEAIAADG